MGKAPEEKEEIFISGRQAQEELVEDQASTSGALESEGSLPCIVNGAMAGLSGGALGFLFGFGGTLIKHRGGGRFRACRTDGWNSAKSFAMFGGVYAFASCMVQRIRDKQDALNGGIAGCATGLALGWSGGPVSAAQNCVMLGLFSYVVDYMQMQSAEAAGRRQRQRQRQGAAAASRHHRGEAHSAQRLDAVSRLLTLALPWVQPPCCCPASPLDLALQHGVCAVRARLQR